ncbi:MAG: DUF2892 domain-containing protein [Candidatus Zixiibacteriota bacterium]|nr:MAG: DUF2892 domain-containing protein [candidate division Zixibacteria bacterium]
MKANVGSFDRIIRFLAGLVILAVGYSFGSWWGLIGLIPILTAFTGFCGLYIPFGISTCKVKKESL